MYRAQSSRLRLSATDAGIIIVFKFKSKKNVRKKRGHRQNYTDIKDSGDFRFLTYDRSPCFSRNGVVDSISACGHTDFADLGNDIVCAGVSTVFRMLAVGMSRLLDRGRSSRNRRHKSGS